MLFIQGQEDNKMAEREKFIISTKKNECVIATDRDLGAYTEKVSSIKTS